MVKKRIILYVPLICLVFLWTSCGIWTWCSKKNIQDKILKYCNSLGIEENSLKGNYMINISDYTDFDWDNMVVYDLSATNEDINNTLGFEFDDYHYGKGMIFVNDNKVVLHEKLNSVMGDSEYIYPLDFSFWNNNEKRFLKVLKFDNNISVFEVSYEKLWGEDLYTLYNIYDTY